MSKYGSNDVAFVLVDGYDLATFLTELTDENEAKTEDTTTLTLDAVAHAYVGLQEFSLDVKGFFDDAAAAINEALAEQEGANRVICYGVEGNTYGKAFVAYAGSTQANYKRAAKSGELQKAAVDFKGRGEVEEGKIVATLAARTTAGDTTANYVDFAASGTGGVAFLQCTALDLGGYTNLLVKLQDSADHVTFADVTGGGFTALTSAPGKQRLAISGMIRRYVAVAWSWTGSGSDQTATFFVGLHKH